MITCKQCGQGAFPHMGKRPFCSPKCENRYYWVRRGSQCREVQLPVAPLLSLIDMEAKRCRHAHGDQLELNYSEVARRVAARIGSTHAAMHRSLFRMKKKEHISLLIADQWAIGLGLHPMLIWGDDWFKGTEAA